MASAKKAKKGYPVGDITISGEITFRDVVPDSPLPEPSILYVRLDDNRKMDAPSKKIAEVEIEIHDRYNRGEPLNYELKVSNFKFGIRYDISACLNIGWSRVGTFEEWLRRGDYLINVIHHVQVKEKSNTIHKNIEVMQF